MVKSWKINKRIDFLGTRPGYSLQSFFAGGPAKKGFSLLSPSEPVHPGGPGVLILIVFSKQAVFTSRNANATNRIVKNEFKIYHK